MAEPNASDGNDSPMQDLYRGKVIFLTGATGVLGELFVEKLLRCNVKRVYILLRAKKQKTHQQRINEVYSTAIFDKLLAIDPHYMDRIVIINGDVGQLSLGISADDIRQLNDTVDIVIHAAANVRFDCPLDTIVLVNVRGTRELLRLAMGFRRLEALVYMSTAYCHSHRSNTSTLEQFYKSPIDAESIIRLAERYAEMHPEGTSGENDVGELALLTAKYIDPWPNTYSFSKAITEDMVKRAIAVLPIIIVRPSIG